MGTRPVCLVTGGSSGIGLATARRFFDEGYDVAICGRSEDRLAKAQAEIEATGAGGQCLVVPIDLTQTEQAIELVNITTQRLKTIDVLVNNAAAAPLGNLESITQETFESTIDINVRSSFYLTQAVWRIMQARAHGVIVNISSMAAVDPFPGFSLYGASKAWLELMTTALAAEGKEQGIRVCAVRPGAVETPMLRGLFPDFPADQCVPPEAIADKVWHCVASPESHPSGEAFPVVAGQS